jgi:glyoxylase-like metal-dependent hydrolase (beta-lactamase superfamily II)
MKSFEQAGISPDEIDIVINTHLHFDHCGWNTRYQDGKPVATFPRATYYVQEGELQHAHEQHERDRVSYMTDNYDPLVNSGQMKLLNGDAEIVPGISVKVYPGHTRDMQAVIVSSGGKVAAYPSDLVCDTKHLDPTWTLGFDLYPLESIANKHRFYDVAIPQQWLVVFTHDHELPWAYLEMGEKGRPVARPIRQKVG